VDIVDVSEIEIGDLIRIPLEMGGYLFASTGQSMDSPVFKVMNKTDSGVDIELELQVMAVLAPYSLFYSEKSDHNKVLKALEVGPAVIREALVPWLVHTLPADDVVERITIAEISETGTIEVDPKKDRQNRCPNPIFGSVKLKQPVASAKFFLSHRPHNGVLELDEDAGTWIYLCTIGKDRNDHFEITIWDPETGAYEVQVVHIWGKCNAVTQVTGTVDLAEGATVTLKPIPLTTETVQLEITDDTLFLPASNYRRQFTPLTVAYPITDISSYTYLILINNLDHLTNVSFVVIEELEYSIGTETYFAYTTNQSPEHLLPNVDPYVLRLYNPTPDPDAISTRVSILAQIEELTYRDNASYQAPALVTNDVDFEVEISAAAYLILKREDIVEIEEVDPES